MAYKTILNTPIAPALGSRPTYQSRTANNAGFAEQGSIFQPSFEQRAVPGASSPYNANAAQTAEYGGFELDVPAGTPPESPKPDAGFSFGDWAKVGTGLVQGYNAYQANKLGKAQFGFAKDSFNVNLANQAQLINNEQESRQRARLETSGQYTGEGGQANLQQDLQSYLKPRQVSGAPI